MSIKDDMSSSQKRKEGDIIQQHLGTICNDNTKNTTTNFFFTTMGELYHCPGCGHLLSESQSMSDCINCAAET